MLLLLLLLAPVLVLSIDNNSINFINKTLTPEEIAFYNRYTGAENIPNPYSNLPLSQSIYSNFSVYLVIRYFTNIAFNDLFLGTSFYLILFLTYLVYLALSLLLLFI